MPVEIFTKEQFEAILPQKNNQPIWECLGLRDNEYAYIVKCTNGNGVAVHIRSSIGPNGLSAECGENSIRVWIVDAEASRKGKDNPLGNKISRWTTREKGWDKRLWNPSAVKEKDKGILWHLGKMASSVRPCPYCGVRVKVFRVKKEGENQGRAFITCNECKGNEEGVKFYEWLNDREFPTKDCFGNKLQQPPEFCPQCDEGKLVWHVAKKGKPENIGRYFVTCQGQVNKTDGGCGFFHFLDEPFEEEQECETVTVKVVVPKGDADKVIASLVKFHILKRKIAPATEEEKQVFNQ